MSRIYWDTMLFIYLLEGNPQFSPRVEAILKRMQERGDTLCTSVFTLGEVLIGPRKVGATAEAQKVRSFFLESGGVELIPFTAATADKYSIIRSSNSTRAADAIHLASAAESGVHLFLTHDYQIQKLVIPGIHFISGLDGSLI